MTPIQAALLVLAALAAGIVNSVAGGGSLISYPALLAVGLAPVSANVTSSLASWPGYLTGTISYRHHLRGQRARLAICAYTSVAGALLGTVALLLAPASAFVQVVPFLVLGSALLMALQGRVSAWLGRKEGNRGSTAALALTVGLAAIYGSYFGAGLGIILLAVLSIFAPGDIHASNAAKIALSTLIATVGNIVYVAFAHIAYVDAAVMAVGFAVGGVLGVKIAKVIPPNLLRWAVTAFGFVVGAVLAIHNL